MVQDYSFIERLPTKAKAISTVVRNSNGHPLASFSARLSESQRSVKAAEEVVQDFKTFLPRVLNLPEGASKQGGLAKMELLAAAKKDDGHLDDYTRMKLIEFAERFKAASRIVENTADNFRDAEASAKQEGEKDLIEHFADAASTFGADLDGIGRSIQLAVECYPKFFAARIHNEMTKLYAISEAGKKYEEVTIE